MKDVYQDPVIDFSEIDAAIVMDHMTRQPPPWSWNLLDRHLIKMLRVGILKLDDNLEQIILATLAIQSSLDKASKKILRLVVYWN